MSESHTVACKIAPHGEHPRTANFRIINGVRVWQETPPPEYHLTDNPYPDSSNADQ